MAVDPNAITYDAAILACMATHLAQPGLDLLQVMVAQRISPDLNSYGMLLYECEQLGVVGSEVSVLGALGDRRAGEAESVGGTAAMNAAAARLMLVGPGLPGAGEAAAAALLEDAASRGCWDSASAQIWRAAAPLRPEPIRPAGSGSSHAPRPSLGSSHGKELCLLRYVLASACPGSPASVCEAVERFGEEVLGANRLWSKVAGGAKGSILAVAAQAAVPTSAGVLEIGSYCGYSAVRLAAALPDVPIVTFEMDPVLVVVARNLVGLAGLVRQVSVLTGHSASFLPRLALPRGRMRAPSFSVVFMDFWASQYHEDMERLESNGLMCPGAVVIADNVLRTGAPLFLWQTASTCGRLSARRQIVRVPEFAMSTEDWLSVSLPMALAPVCAAPEDVCELHRASEQMRERVFGPGRSVSLAERASFAEYMQAGFARTGIAAVTACALDASFESPCAHAGPTCTRVAST